MDKVETANMNVYSSVFEDMYYLSNNIPRKTSSSDFIKKIENKLKNNITDNDSIQKMKEENINTINTKLQKRIDLRSKVINPIDS